MENFWDLSLNKRSIICFFWCIFVFWVWTGTAKQAPKNPYTKDNIFYNVFCDDEEESTPLIWHFTNIGKPEKIITHGRICPKCRKTKIHISEIKDSSFLLTECDTCKAVWTINDGIPNSEGKRDLCLKCDYPKYDDKGYYIFMLFGWMGWAFIYMKELRTGKFE